jgi:hypothetical protein
VISAPTNRRSENVGVVAVVIPELKLRNVKRQIFCANLVERANHAAFQDRPKTFNRIRVDRADNGMFGIFALGVINDAVRITVVKATICGVVVSAEQANAIGYGFFDEIFNRVAFNVFNDASNNVALALHSTDHDFLAETAPLIVSAFIPMAVLILAANIGFVYFDDAAKLGFRFDQCSADFVAHGVGRAVATEAKHALNLKGAHPLLAGQHQMGDAEPITQRFIRVLKNGASNVRKAITRIRRALIALPLVFHSPDRKDLWVAAARTMNAIGPAALHQIRLAGFFVRERRVELGDGHLMDWLRSTGHVASPVYGGQYGR